MYGMVPCLVFHSNRRFLVIKKSAHQPLPHDPHGWLGTPMEWTDSTKKRWTIQFEWGYFQGSPHPFQLRISIETGSAPITAKTINEIPFRDLTKFDLQHTPAPSISELKVPRPKSATGPQRGHALNEDTLAIVADLYRFALRRGLSPATYIAETMNISKSTAAKRIMAARRHQFLGQAPSSKKGEL
jgi:hypothetical protein